MFSINTCSRCIIGAVCVLYVYVCLLHERCVYALCCVAYLSIANYNCDDVLQALADINIISVYEIKAMQMIKIEIRPHEIAY